MSDKIDWKQMFKERRCKIMGVRTEDVICGLLINSGELPMPSVIRKFDMPKNWVINGVYYNHACGEFEFIIVSDEFGKLHDGMMTPRLNFTYRTTTSEKEEAILTQSEKIAIIGMCEVEIDALECAQYKQPDELETLRNVSKKMEEDV